MNGRDCAFVVADSNMEYTLRGLLGRAHLEQTLGCAAFAFDARLDLVVAVGDNDPGLFQRVESYARPLLKTHDHVVIMIDVEWAGSPGADKIRGAILDGCLRSGWSAEAVAAIAIEPELENWIWQDNKVVETVVGYRGPSLRQALADAGSWPLEATKPIRPKETLEQELRRNRVPRSSALYQQIASRVSVKECTDSSFLELRSALQRWFPTDAVPAE